MKISLQSMVNTLSSVTYISLCLGWEWTGLLVMQHRSHGGIRSDSQQFTFSCFPLHLAFIDQFPREAGWPVCACAPPSLTPVLAIHRHPTRPPQHHTTTTTWRRKECDGRRAIRNGTS
ncbi:hypothetical protein E2C01_060008 [Portunus trituberculatus]|uniref:Uncharacterized protein n=1 Tax=Portunus trituberculatus TaxID=210409 RepID=A0A5B7GZV5_PORTR|nr:hypothetical protein [Portunus trituberculatus]